MNEVEIVKGKGKVGGKVKVQGMFDYCIECDDFTEYTYVKKEKKKLYKGKEYKYTVKVPICSECGSEVPIHGQSDLEVQAFFKAYRKEEGIIELYEIKDLMCKYNIGKEPLALALGLGKVTIKRYFAGQIPSKKNSQILYDALNNIEFMEKCLEKNKLEVGVQAYNKAKNKIEKLLAIKSSKLEQVANYIIRYGEITPLALQKLLSFVQGISGIVNKNLMFPEMCQAWAHGPVYPSIYEQYKEYSFNEIEPVAETEDLESLISEEDEEVIDLVMRTFGLYSGKILEFISHEQEPWINSRQGCLPGERCDNYIPNEAILDYYKKLDINTEEKINKYIMRNLEKYQSSRTM